MRVLRYRSNTTSLSTSALMARDCRQQRPPPRGPRRWGERKIASICFGMRASVALCCANSALAAHSSCAYLHLCLFALSPTRTQALEIMQFALKLVRCSSICSQLPTTRTIGNPVAVGGYRVKVILLAHSSGHKMDEHHSVKITRCVYFLFIS